MKKIIFFVLVILVGFLAYWLSMQKVNPKGDSRIDTVSTASSTQSRLKIFDIHNKEGNESLGYTIDVTYPKISGLPISMEAVANQLIQDFITTKTEQLKQNAVNFNPESGLSPSSLQIDYTLTALNAKILSLEFNIYEHVSGAAHPNSYIHTFNYNIKDGKLVTRLQDVFVSGANYIPTISLLTRADLKEQLKSEMPSIEANIDSGTEPKEENFQEFVLTTHGLKLIFNPYQVGPYALGGQQVLISYEKLKDLLPPNSFLLDFK